MNWLYLTAKQCIITTRKFMFKSTFHIRTIVFFLLAIAGKNDKLKLSYIKLIYKFLGELTESWTHITDSKQSVSFFFHLNIGFCCWITFFVFSMFFFSFVFFLCFVWCLICLCLSSEFTKTTVRHFFCGVWCFSY